MNRTQLPSPPNPDAPSFARDPGAWQTAMYNWAVSVKQRVETDSAVNVRPVSPFVVSTYTPVNTLTGTDATSNFLATFIAALQSKGLSSTRNVT